MLLIGTDHLPCFGSVSYDASHCLAEAPQSSAKIKFFVLFTT